MNTVLLDKEPDLSDSPDFEDEEEVDLCKGLKAVDLAKADVPEREYDSGIGDDSKRKSAKCESNFAPSLCISYFLVNLKVPTDPMQQRCGGVIDAAKEVAGKAGSDTVDMLSDLAKTLLSKMVVNEEVIVEQGPITLMAKM